MDEMIVSPGGVEKLQNDITSLSNQIENIVVAGSCIARTGHTVLRSYINCINKAVSGHIEMTITATGGSWATIADVNPAPFAAVNFEAIDTGNGQHVGMVNINAAGKVEFYALSTLTSRNVAWNMNYNKA